MAQMMRMPNAKLNGALISNMSIESPSQNTYPKIDITIIPSDYLVMDYFIKLMRGDGPPGNTMGLHLIEDEWLCVWCGSVNPFSNRHCSQCGGQRGFLLGNGSS